MRWNTFARSACFAAGAAVGSIPWLVLTSPLVGARRGLVSYLVVLAATYVAGLVPHGRRRFWAALAAAVLGSALAFATHTLAELTIGLAVMLGTLRSTFLYRARTPRAVATEIVLVAAGLLFARFLAHGPFVPVALAIWGFFLLQSTFFLLGGVAERPARGRHPDPFEEAHGRALALLQDEV